MIAVTAIAKSEAAGWRGQIIDEDGHVRTRTANLYPNADKAIAGAQRLWSFQLKQLRAQLTPDVKL